MQTDATTDKIQQTLDKQFKEDQAGRVASAVPLPGALADVFALHQDIEVGRWSVRPFYDIDFEFLQNLRHPLFGTLMKQAGQFAGEVEEFTPRGEHAWTLCWMLTRRPEVTEGYLSATGGDKKLLADARKEFGMLQYRALEAVVKAAVTQMTNYWNPVISYGPAAEKGESAAAQNPPSSAAQSTVSAG